MLAGRPGGGSVSVGVACGSHRFSQVALHVWLLGVLVHVLCVLMGGVLGTGLFMADSVLVPMSRLNPSGPFIHCFPVTVSLLH